MTTFDAIVVGSGASGATAAQTLVESGASVLMLDCGIEDRRYAGIIPHKTFDEIRRTEPEQYRYLLGERFESAAYRALGAGAQLTPPRRYIVERVAELLPTHAGSFAPVESIALGGLAGGWGLLCGVYSDAELTRASLPIADMRGAYQAVADRIGISGADDDARPYTSGGIAGIQSPLPLDPAPQRVLSQYECARAAIRGQGFHFGRPALALLTHAKDGREATQLRNMDFYDDAERAAWRPALVVDALRRRPNFAYAGSALVTRFEERADSVEAVALDMNDRSERRYAARRLILACGALGSARIALRSLHGDGAALPLLCNPYTYAPCIVPSQIGRSMPERASGLVQLVGFHDSDGSHADVAVATLFSYRSLMLFRLLRETPLSVRDARLVLQYVLSGLLIVGIDHPQTYSDARRIRLESDAASPTGDALAFRFDLTDDERRACGERERRFLKVLRRLGAWAIKRVHPPLGSSIHYAGTLPYGDIEKPFTLDRSGRLRGTRSVYVADASGFTFLPAKGVTLSLMANAHRVAAGFT